MLNCRIKSQTKDSYGYFAHFQKRTKEGGKKTPKSAPPAHIKRKKLEEEIDDQLSDENFDDDFEVLIMYIAKYFHMVQYLLIMQTKETYELQSCR